MANIMMPTIMSQSTSGAGVDSKAQLPVDKDGSFAQHLDRQIRSSQRDKDSLAGVKPAEQAKAAKQVKATKEEDKADNETPASVQAILQQLMTKLQDMAKTSDSAAAGQWTFQLKDTGLLEKLAAQAGMDGASLELLKKQMQQQGGLSLNDLFAALQKNFAEQTAQTKVTASETSLPLLENLLTKLGVSADDIKKLDTQSVTGTDQLDLTAFLKGLQGLSAQAGSTAQDVTLSDWDVEQLTAMMTEAGVPAATIQSIFPEKMGLQQKALAGLGPNQGNQPVVMTLDRMKDMLGQAVSVAQGAKPQPDVSGFFDTLNTIASQSGFQDKGVGWSPVIQGAMSAAYEKLQKMVDQARDTKTMQMQAGNEALRNEWQLSGKQQAAEATAVGNASLPQGEAGGLTADEAAALVAATKKNGAPGSEQPSANTLNTLGAMDMKSTPQVQTDVAAKVAPLPRVPFSDQLQQLTVDQISQGVLRGLRDNEHHLTLTLYPKELGEVKVDLHVRGSQLSATFVMENQKVKEALEGNMGEFKDNLERRGFSLGAMSVSVGQQNDQGDSNQRFAAAWEQMVSNQNQATASVTPVLDAANLAASQTLRSPQGGGISLFV